MAEGGQGRAADGSGGRPWRWIFGIGLTLLASVLLIPLLLWCPRGLQGYYVFDTSVMGGAPGDSLIAYWRGKSENYHWVWIGEDEVRGHGFNGDSFQGGSATFEVIERQPDAIIMRMSSEQTSDFGEQRVTLKLEPDGTVREWLVEWNFNDQTGPTSWSFDARKIYNPVLIWTLKGLEWFWPREQVGP